MRNTIYFKWFMESLSENDKKEYQEMSINNQKGWYISYLENHFSIKQNNEDVYYQPNLSDKEWYENRQFNTTDVFHSFANAKAMFPNNEIGAYSGEDIPDRIFID